MKLHKFLLFLLPGILLCTAFSPVPVAIEPLPPDAPAAGTAGRSLFLPLVFDSSLATRPAPRPQAAPVFGMETHLAFGLDDLPEPDVHWLRNNVVLWSVIEPQEGARNWDALALYDSEWRLAHEMGKEMILVVRSTPEWAQAYPGAFCGPIRREKLASFARFMHDLVARYSRPPYSIRHWELWNEPDVAPSMVSGDSPFGCWGDSEDFYYGGGYFAEMLKAAYPEIKAADPNAKVLTGGLLLDCDPRPGGGCRSEEKARPPRFLEGILRNGGGEFFDAVGFHTYDRYASEYGKYNMLKWNSSWNTTGPVLIAKARFIREVLARYGVPEKPLFNTETAMMVYDKDCGNSCQLSKAYYLVHMVVASMAEGLEASIWYSSQNSWRHTGLFGVDGNALPAYPALETSWNWLSAATFIQELSLQAGLKGYEFERAGQRIWVLWSTNGKEHLVQVSGRVEQVVDLFGTPLVVNGDELIVSMAPVFVAWTP